MSSSRKFVSALLVSLLALAPIAADARAGASLSGGAPSYSSMGSRGSRTYSAVAGADTVQRSLTPSSGQSGLGGPAAPISPFSNRYEPPSFTQRHPFVSGVLGGIAGSWLAGMIFGGSGTAHAGGFGHAGGAFGSFLTLFVLVAIGWAAFRTLRLAGRGFGLPGRPAAYAMGGYAPASPGPAPQTALTLADSDFKAFADTLNQVQFGWGNGDLAHLKRFTTPEMLSYFAEQLANNQSQALQNRVHHVVLLQGEPREAWAEGIVDYATVHLRWSAVDYTVRVDRRPSDAGFIVEGDPQRPVEARELWSFRRSQGGRWLLSAIQQA
jgi:hypothetical protein